MQVISLGIEETVCYKVEPRYNEFLGTMKITLLYQVSHYIRVKKQRNIKSWEQLNHLIIRGFCYIRPLITGFHCISFLLYRGTLLYQGYCYTKTYKELGPAKLPCYKRVCYISPWSYKHKE